jgi:flagellar hook-length control protein FliK
MGAIMETQPTQPGLMQLFTSLGLATDSSLAALGGAGPEGEGFAGLLSGYLPNQAGQQSKAINSNALSLQEAEQPAMSLLNSATITDENLPLLGQTLPLEAISPENSPVNILTEEEAAGVGSQLGLNKLSRDSAFNQGLHDTSGSKDIATEHDASLQALEEQGFHAQSLVSSVIGFDASPVKKLNITPNIATESAKAAQVLPQQVGYSFNELKTATSAQALTAAELDEMSGESTDRFLGSESLTGLRKPSTSRVPESLPAAPMLTAAQPTVVENAVSLALAMNQDPTSQTLDELIDGEAIEKSDFETELKSLEKKQDDQTLKLSKGQQAWGDTITERITMNAAQDIKQVTIHLDPPELGTLELKMKINDDNLTQVQVQVQNPQVKEALESSAHRLRDMLASEGLELSEFDVQTDANRGEQSSQNSDEQGQGQSQDSDASQNSTEEISLEMPRPKNNNLLDTFV